MSNLISFLFQLKTLLLLAILFIFLFYYDDGLKKEIKDNANIDIQGTLSENKNTQKQKSVLETSTIYLMYKNKFKVEKVIDGDTIYVKKILENGNLENYVYKIRMMAIDTLEKDSEDAREVCLANLATEYTKNNLIGKNIYIYGDSTQPETDQYKRVLAYVLIEGEKEFFNDKVIKTGFAKTFKASPPATNWEKYEDIRKKMEAEKKGIWDVEVCKI